MTVEDRIVMIDMLVVMTGKGESYFNDMTDERLGQEYDRMMEMPNG